MPSQKKAPPLHQSISLISFSSYAYTSEKPM